MRTALSIYLQCNLTLFQDKPVHHLDILHAAIMITVVLGSNCTCGVISWVLDFLKFNRLTLSFVAIKLHVFGLSWGMILAVTLIVLRRLEFHNSCSKHWINWLFLWFLILKFVYLFKQSFPGIWVWNDQFIPYRFLQPIHISLRAV